MQMSVKKIRSPEDLEQMREKILSEAKKYRTRILICMTGCRALGAADVAQAFRDRLKAFSLEHEATIVETGCIGLCARAPVVLIEPYEYFYGGVKPEDVDEIIETTIKKGEPVTRLAVTQSGESASRLQDISFYREQNRIVLENCGRIDPRRIDDAIGCGVYAAAIGALYNRTPEEVIQEVLRAGLRGRGGAGFPTGKKWELCRRSPGEEKYLICNADEGDPGAFMDRALLEGDPHRIIEGMIIAAYAIGATHGFIYVRAEYPIAVEHIGIALDQARRFGLLGKDIAGSGFGFDIEVRMGAGAFVCGEETALIASLEGKRGMPNPRPPFPAEKGYQGKPTNINNVETFGNIPSILKNGAEWYQSIGTDGSKGTKIFALAGKVNNTGLVEVPMGTTLREIIFEIGGGIPKGRKFKAAQMGGPSGGCIPAQFLDLPIDYDSVKDIGAIMGSGGLIVMDENTCMVDIARFFMEFVQAESCGKCTPCRVGTKQMLQILESICEGKASLKDLERLETLANHIRKASLCGLGQTAPNSVLSTLRYFRDEYEEHIILKHCRAGKCEGLVSSPCRHVCPAGVNAPEYLALVADGRTDDAADIIRRRNPFVSICGRICDHPCEKRCRRGEVDEPLAIRAVKRYIGDNMRDFSRLMARPVTEPPEIAIVGAGPAGLSCAYFLALMGRSSVVFEAQDIPGGMLALGIPEYRLPRDILNKEIEFILSHGVKLHTGRRVEDARDLLKEGYKTIFVATGAHRGRKLGIEGEELDGVVDGLVFLRDQALGRSDGFDGRKLVVLGGGNVAIDAARSAIRLGASQVSILYRRSREDMPAYEEEVEEAIREGIELETLTIPKRILGSKSGVTGIETMRAMLGETDKDGRRRPVPIEGSETLIECDVVIPAIGQIPSAELIAWEGGPEMTSRGAVKADPLTLSTTMPAIFAGGDCVTGGTTVIEAIASGQKTAQSIDKFLGGNGVLPPDAGLTYTRPTDEELANAKPRARETHLAPEQRKLNFKEVVSGFAAEQALCEAKRCLRCDLEE